MGTTRHLYPRYQNQSSQHETKMKLQKSSPNNCHKHHQWLNISIQLSLHILSRINHYLPAVQKLFFFPLSLIACTWYLLTLQTLHNYACNILEWKVGNMKQLEIHHKTPSYVCFFLCMFFLKLLLFLICIFLFLLQNRVMQLTLLISTMANNVTFVFNLINAIATSIPCTIFHEKYFTFFPILFFHKQITEVLMAFLSQQKLTE